MFPPFEPYDEVPLREMRLKTLSGGDNFCPWDLDVGGAFDQSQSLRLPQ